MTKRQLVSDFDLCTGCSICTLVCSRRWMGGYNPRFACLWIENKMDGLVSDPIVCNQCENAYCVQVCPVSAIERQDGIPVVNRETCIGCEQCQQYCPRDVIVIHDRKAHKCDLCQGAPLCVSNCPTGALSFIDEGKHLRKGDEVQGVKLMPKQNSFTFTGTNKGAMDRVLKIDLSEQKSWVEEISPEIKELFVGGKGLATWLLYNDTKSYQQVDPYGEENPVIFAGGPLTGTAAPAMRGVAVSTSPLTNGYVDSYYGGHFAQEIKYAGFDALVIRGKSKKPVVLAIKNDDVEFLDGDEYWGKDTFQVNKQIKKDMNDNSLKIASIGQAGENQIPYALVSCEYNRHAGRGGIGSVMGSKQLKAISVAGTNTIGVYDEDAFDAAIKRANSELQSSEEVTELTESGTSPTLWFAHSEGLLPVNNYQRGTFNPDGLSNQAQNKQIWLRDEGCASCPIRCSKVGVIRDGKHKGTHSDIVEYETAALMGTNLGLSDIREVAYLLHLCDALGMDGMSAGSTIGFAMECFEEGILSSDDCDGIELAFGSSENVDRVLTDIAYNQGTLGKLLAKGTKKAAEELGKEAKDRASHVKGMDIPAWGPRGAPGMGLAYMTADRGACHQRAFPIDYEVGGAPFNGKTFERYQIEGKAEAVASDQNFLAALDTFVKCDFGTFGISQESYAKLFESATGEKFDEQRLYQLGERIWNVSKLFNLKQGITKKDEKLPKRFHEPLPDGPAQGHKFTQEDERIMLEEYYKYRGWDEQGYPTESKLQALGISDLV